MRVIGKTPSFTGHSLLTYAYQWRMEGGEGWTTPENGPPKMKMAYKIDENFAIARFQILIFIIIYPVLIFENVGSKLIFQ